LLHDKSLQYCVFSEMKSAFKSRVDPLNCLNFIYVYIILCHNFLKNPLFQLLQ
jgi:hypothetical protein